MSTYRNMDTIEKELIFLLHILIAAVLTGFIGYERGRVSKPAGVRTNMLVGGGVCLFVILGEGMVLRFSGIGIAVALRHYILAIGVTLFVLFINWLLAQTWFKKKEG